jgi:hypothetical protein
MGNDFGTTGDVVGISLASRATGIALKANSIDSATCLYLVALTAVLAYITTKNAKSKVMKSEYETSHRS